MVGYHWSEVVWIPYQAFGSFVIMHFWSLDSEVGNYLYYKYLYGQTCCLSRESIIYWLSDHFQLCSCFMSIPCHSSTNWILLSSSHSDNGAGTAHIILKRLFWNMPVLGWPPQRAVVLYNVCTVEHITSAVFKPSHDLIRLRWQSTIRRLDVSIFTG